jgi:hypothetical protein
MHTGWLIAAGIVMPAIWGWLCEALLRRLRPGAANRSGRPPSGSGSAAVDFQI